MSVLTILLLVVWGISALGLIVLVLMHSGEGTGVSDLIAGTMYNSQSGTSVLERNLDRLTLICAVVFAVCLVAMMVFYPQGTIG